MSKRELEELERRQREEGRDGERERSPDRNARPPGELPLVSLLPRPVVKTCVGVWSYSMGCCS